MVGNPNHDEQGKFSSGNSIRGQIEQSVAYLNAKKKRDDIMAELKKHKEKLDSFPKGAMNLTPDHVKALPEWKETKANVDNTFKKLQNFNSVFTKTFKKEIDAERKAKYG